MRPTTHVRILVLAALAGCTSTTPTPAPPDTDDSDVPDSDPSSADTDESDRPQDSDAPHSDPPESDRHTDPVDTDAVDSDTDLPCADSDGDGACDDVDRCVGPGVLGDYDRDGVCDEYDACIGLGVLADKDFDRVCDDYDDCVGPGRVADTDGDGICQDQDGCEGFGDVPDADGDGRCDDQDACRGVNELGDADGDAVCDDLDVCSGHDAAGDADADGLCDDADPCDDRVVPVGADCTPPATLPRNPCGGTAVYFEGRNTGFVKCPDGSVDRLFATSGWLRDITSHNPSPLPLPAPPGSTCTADADCTGSPDAVCAVHGPWTWPASPETYACVTRCDSDADCGAGQACLPPTASGVPVQLKNPETATGYCIAATCLSSEDCASGECGYSWNVVSCYGVSVQALMCRTEDDQCAAATDCAPSYSPARENRSCVQDAATATWECHYFQVCGRPLLDDAGHAVLAPVRVGDGWSHGVRLTATAPAPVGGHWARIGTMEHASVASFARHALELMALGAPADLLADVTAAMHDEVVHAQLAFGIASALGHDAAPGPMPLHDVRVSTDPRDVLLALVREGCVGETVAATEAAWLAERATDPTVRATLTQIANDEARHAALAWRTVAWLLAVHPELAETFTHAVHNAVERLDTTGDAEGLVTWGVIDTAGRGQVIADVIADVIAPALAQLTGGRRAA